MKLWLMVKILLGFVCVFILWGLSVTHTSLGRIHKSMAARAAVSTRRAPDCRLILAGDSHEVTAANDTVYSQPRSPVTDDDVVKLASDCENLVSNGNYTLQPLSDEEEAFPLAYIMTVHKNAEQVEKLLQTIYTPQNVYCIHVDTKSSPSFKKAIRQISQCFRNVFLASKPVDVVYGGFTRLLADIHCMEDLLAVQHPWMYVLNVCGQELPLKTNREIVKILKKKNGTNDIAGVIPTDPEIRRRFEVVHEYKIPEYETRIRPVPSDTPKEPPPNNVTILFGSAYNVFSRQFVEYVTQKTFPKLLLNWFRDTYSPDENYWVTLNFLNGTPGGQLKPSWNSVARSVKWKQMAPQYHPPCQGVYQRDICIYGVGDLQWLTTRHTVIANKFDLDVDHVAVKCMMEWVMERRYRERRNSSDIIHIARHR